MTVNMTDKSGQTPLMCACYKGGRLDNIKRLLELGADIQQLEFNAGWSALHFAARDSSPEIIEYLLSLGMTVNMTSKTGRTPLMCACLKAGRLDNIKRLLELGADIQQLEFNAGWSALHFAARDSSPEIIEYLLSLGMTVNMTSKTGRTPLMCACLKAGRLDNIKRLLELGADIRQLEFNAGWSALHFAARDSSPEIIEYLLSLGMTVNMTSKTGRTPLMCACFKGGRLGNIKRLLEFGADIQQLEFNDGWSALHFAARDSNPEIIEFLLSLRMTVNMTDKSGRTPLMCACLKAGRLDNIKRLLELGADIQQLEFNAGWSALHFAARDSSPEIIEYLLSLGMTVNMTSKTGRTPLMCACFEVGRLDNIKRLLELGADIQQLEFNDGWSAFHFAATYSSPEIIEYLLSLGMTVNMTDKSGRTPLMCACLEGGRLDNIKRLLELGADIQQLEFNAGWSALHFAATYSSPEIIEYLLSLGMTVNMTDKSGRTPLMCACLKAGRLDNIKRLLELGADIQQLEFNDGWSALHFAATYSSPKIIEYLLSLGMTVNMTDKSGRTPLMCACLEGGRLDNIKRLLELGADIQQLEFNAGWSALHFAATYSSPEIIEYLLSLGMTVNMTDKSGRTPLMCACLKAGRLDNIKRLLELGADIQQLEFNDGWSALHFAATYSSPKIIEYLLSLGMTVNMTDKSGRTPLMCACLEGGRLDNIKRLLELGADIQQLEFNDGWSALHFAATYSSPEIIEYLLSLGMTVNMTDKSGRTPLMCACLKAGRLDNIKRLFELGADIHQLQFNDGWSALHFAATYSSPEIIEYLLSLGMTVNMTSKTGRTPLMCACLKAGRLDNIKRLLELGADIQQKEFNDGWSALHFAARYSSPEIIEYLLSLGMTVNMTSKTGQTPLMCACFEAGRLDNIKRLLELGADIQQLEFNAGWSALHIAARDSSPEIIEYLLSLGMTVNMTSKTGQTPLMCACLKAGRLDNIKRLLELGADIQQLEFNDRWSALHFAATDLSPEIIEYLLSLGMTVNMTSKTGRTPLMCACLKAGRLDNIKRLLELGADIQQLEFNDGWSALHFAATYSSPEIIEYLLSLGMTVNMTDKSGRTPLMCACLKAGRLDNIKRLLELGADIQQLEFNDGWSALHFAATYSSPEIIEYLLSLGMTVNMTDKSGRTPLMCACLKAGRLDKVKRLLELGADIQQLDYDGWSALHFAARDSSPEIIEYLLSLGMTVNMTSKTGRTPLMCACLKAGRLDNIKRLLELGADIQQLEFNAGWSALHFAATYSSPEIIEYLLSLGMTVNMTDKSGRTPLMCACLKAGRLDNIKRLLELGADIQQLDYDGWSALHFAARDSSPEIIEYLLSLGMTVNMTSKTGRTPLMCACLKAGRLDNIKRLLELGADIQQLEFNAGWSALHFAATYSSPEIIEYLLSLGMTVNMTDKSGRTPLMCACLKAGRLDNIKRLLELGADIQQLEFNDGWSALHFAATYSSPEIIEYLLSLGMTVNMTDKSGRTPLMCACLKAGRLDKVKRLLELGADIQQLDYDGWSALHFAARYSSPEIIEYLLSLGMTVNMTSKTGQTPLMCACLKAGRLDNIKRLLELGADIQQLEFNDRWSALHFAARDLSPEIIEYLLSLGMTVNMTSKTGRTPLMCSCLEGGRLDNIKRLLELGADIQQLEFNDGWSALHFAARDSSPEIIEYLLSLGMTVNMTSKTGRTPLMCSCLEGGRLDNIKRLLELGADIQQLEFNAGWSALHFAARDSSPEIIEYLLSLGMTVNMTDKSGRTPLMCSCLEGGRLDNIKRLLELGADIQQLEFNAGWSALHFAARDSSPEIIEYLLSLGMTVNMTDKSGQTPLMCACLEGGRLDNIKRLLELGADIQQLEFNDRWSALHIAARDSSPEIIEYLLSLGMTVNMTDKSGQTPLMCACYKGGRLDNIKRLLELGADIQQLDYDEWSALHIAAGYLSPEIIEYLLSLGMTVNMTNNSGMTPLLAACCSIESNCNICILLKSGAFFFAEDDLHRNVFHYAALNSHSAALKFLLNYCFRHGIYFRQLCCDTNCYETTSIENVSVDDFEISQAINSPCSDMSIVGINWDKIMFNKVDLNSLDEFGMSPLMLACERNNFSNAKLLIEYGANVNAKGTHDFTAYHFAAKYGCLQLLEYLFLSNGNLNAVDAFNGGLLYWACEGNNLDAVKFLVAKGVRLDIMSTEGWNLLHIAVVCADREICEYLLENNVSLKHLDNRGRNPLSLALEINRKDVIRLLLQRQNFLIPHNVCLIGNVLYNTASTAKEDAQFAIQDDNSRTNDGENEQYLRKISTLEKLVKYRSFYCFLLLLLIVIVDWQRQRLTTTMMIILNILNSK